MSSSSIKRFTQPTARSFTTPSDSQSDRTEPTVVVHDASTSAPTSQSLRDDIEVEHSQTPPPLDFNASVRFPIDWKAVRHNNRPLIGEIGWRILHKRVQGGEIKTSAIWLHGADLSWTPPNKPPKRLFLCKRCHEARQHSQATFIYNGTTHIREHLRSKHSIRSDGLEMEPKPAKRRSPWEGLKVNDDSFDDSSFYKAFPDWVLKQNISYRSATHEDTRRIFARIRPDMENLMYNSHSSLSRLIVGAYKNRQLEVKSRLLTAKSQITLSCDVWTSTNHFSLLGVVAHFIEHGLRRQTALIALPRLIGGHTGENLAEALHKVVDKYEVNHKIGCVMMDNASNNDTMMDLLIEKIPTLQRRARLRCSGHILNLVVKAILYGQGVNEFERKILGCSDKEHFNLWRRFGAIGKVHNFVKFVCRSPKQREKFETYQIEAAEEEELFDWIELMLIKDGGVRWNSTYFMLKRAKVLQKAITLFQKDNDKQDEEETSYSVSEDRITNSDWTEIDRFLTLLRPITKATKLLEGNSSGEISSYGSLWQIFPTLNVLSELLDKAIDQTKDEPDSYFKNGAVMGKQKLDQYWDKMTTETPFYIAATILNPSLKLAYFEDKWRRFPDWHKRAKQQMEKLFKEYVADSQSGDYVDERVTVRPPVPPDDDLSDDDILRFHLRVDEHYSSLGRSSKRRKVENELKEYYNDGLVDLDVISDNPLGWWISQANSTRNSFPTLTQMAFDLFSVPAMSAECERVFSQAAKVVTDERNRLNAATIEANECQKNWLRRGLVASDL